MNTVQEMKTAAAYRLEFLSEDGVNWIPLQEYTVFERGLMIALDGALTPGTVRYYEYDSGNYYQRIWNGSFWIWVRAN